MPIRWARMPAARAACVIHRRAVTRSVGQVWRGFAERFVRQQRRHGPVPCLSSRAPLLLQGTGRSPLGSENRKAHQR